MTVAGERLLERLGPLATYDADNGSIVAALAEALALPQAVVDDVARDTATHLAWHPALDPDTCPAAWLPWLAQFAGVTLLPSDTEDQQRQRIATAAGFHRGTLDSTAAEIQLVLTGAKFVSVLKPNPDDPWHQTVLTRTSETPDPAAIQRAALAQKPAGVIFTFVASDAPIIDEGTRTINAATSTIDSAAVADVT